MAGFAIFNFDWIYKYDDRVVSAIKFNQCIRECQLLNKVDVNHNIDSLLTMNLGKTNSNIFWLMRDTKEVALYALGSSVVRNDYKLVTVCYNSLGLNSYIGNLNLIRLNQVLFTAGLIQFNGFSKIKKGMFEGQNIQDLYKSRKPVAFNNMFNFYNHLGVLTAGLMPISNPVSLFIAAAGRSMSGLNYVGQSTVRFIKTCEALVSKVISNTMMTFRERDAVQQFRDNNLGKRSRKQVDAMVAAYLEYQKPGRRFKKQHKNGAFVKFEDSTKIVRGESKVRPRMIMTMNLCSSINLSNIDRKSVV